MAGRKRVTGHEIGPNGKPRAVDVTPPRAMRGVGEYDSGVVKIGPGKRIAHALAGAIFDRKNRK